ncbi:hydroxyacylglutathione hydrolase [mine drainage metagenome]|uniref:hydroxyacylglutathione hydrolase n=1 Tax=mine drainage metagenome TaxID=410659 RepID=A0A1J5RC18_9ZZZZ
MLSHLKIIPIPAFQDNYIWLIHNDVEAIVVDPGDAEVVCETLIRLKLQLVSILITHHHHDHIDGVTALMSQYPATTVFAPKQEKYQFNHTPVNESDVIEFKTLDLQFTIIKLPGHTLGHIAYYAHTKDQHNLLFCGDTLFGAGCGRLFEGTPEQMYASLQKLASLPSNTQVYSAHEYTLHNISFALTLEPNNLALIERQLKTFRLRDLQQPSLPSTIGLELATNPFLRCFSSEIQSSIGLVNASNLQVFSTIRELRNHY